MTIDQPNKKADSSGRKATTRSVSMMPDDWKWIDERLKGLSPRVKGVSHYFQLLADLDKREHLMEKALGISVSTESSGAETARKMAAGVLGRARSRRTRESK